MTEQNTTLSLGQQLRQRREQLGLTLQQVSEQTHIKLAALSNIENDQFQVSGIEPTFIKGYVRNYIRFLRLPVSLLESVNVTYGEEVQNDLSKNQRTTKSVNHYASHGHWVRRITWLIVIVIIGMTVLWWWQGYQQSQNERADLVESHLQSQVTHSTDVAEMPIIAESPVNQSSVVVEELPSVPTSAKTSENNAVTGNLEQTLLASSTQINNTKINSADSNSEKTQNSQVIVYPTTSTQALATEMEKITANDTQEVTNTSSNKSAAIVQDGLQIEITAASSWVSVKNVNGKELAAKVYRKGEILSFSGSPSYAVVIGAPANVKVMYNGQNVPIKADVKVARLKLPLE